MTLTSYQKWLKEQEKKYKKEYTKGYDYWLKNHNPKDGTV